MRVTLATSIFPILEFHMNRLIDGSIFLPSCVFDIEFSTTNRNQQHRIQEFQKNRLTNGH